MDPLAQKGLTGVQKKCVKSAKVHSKNLLSHSCYNAFYKHWSSNFTICLKVILQNNDIVCWGFSNSPLQYGYYIQTVIVFHWIFLLPTQWASLYYFMRIYTMWFLPHFFSRWYLFTFKTFCRILRWYIFSSSITDT